MRSSVSTGLATAVERTSVENDGQMIRRTGADALRSVISPTLSGNVLDWAPTGLGTSRIVRVTPTGGWGIHGIDISQFPVGQRNGVCLDFLNLSTAQADAYFFVDATSSSAQPANQLLCPLGKFFYVPPLGRASIWYDELSTKWRFRALPRAISATLVVAVPALAAAASGYVNVSTVGTQLEGILAGTPITANPQTDVEAAGAGNGGFINARVSATSTIRFFFIGATTGGNVNFTVGWP